MEVSTGPSYRKRQKPQETRRDNVRDWVVRPWKKHAPRGVADPPATANQTSEIHSNNTESTDPYEILDDNEDSTNFSTARGRRLRLNLHVFLRYDIRY